MIGHRVAFVSFATVAFVATATSFASAQHLGTFRWQFAPFCNVVTLDAVQQANTISLSGFDDQCGAPVSAPATGSAHVNPSGSISVALTVTRPDGIALSSSIEVNLATVSGPWKDDAGNSGTFVFSPASPATGSPRRVVLRGVYSAGFTAVAAGEIHLTQFSFGRALPAAPSAPDANIVLFGEAPTANCPGSLDNPQAAPGHLCLYEGSTLNAAYRVFDGIPEPLAINFDVANRFGAHLYVTVPAAGFAAFTGAWAVTIP